jgi:hypothetical protein
MNNLRAKKLTYYNQSRIFRGTTALGFSLLTYGGNIHLSLIADESIIENERSLMRILEDIVHEINAAYDNITLTRLSRSINLSVETPTEKGK